MKTLKDTVVMMESENFEDRFKAEYMQLRIRIDGLKGMLVKHKEGTLPFTPKCSYDLLNAQLKAMELYAYYLEERAIVESIDLFNL